MQSFLIRNGQIVTHLDVFKGDILINHGKVQQVGANLKKVDSKTRIIEAEGLYVLPGGIDPHVHMELDVGGGLVSADNFETGTAAAIAGGTTSIIDFVTPTRQQSLLEALKERKAAARKSLCDYGLHMSITGWNVHTAAEMRKCVEDEGIPSFKVYMAYKETIGLDDKELLKVMDTARHLHARIALHCEHGDMVTYLRERFVAKGKTIPFYHPKSRPVEVEREAVIRALTMARITRCPLYIVHVSTLDAMTEIAAAIEKGQDIMAETCPHYLLFDDSQYDEPGVDGAAFVMSPPLRPSSHKHGLWRLLQKGQIGIVATDHCPFNMKGGKDRGKDDFTKIPNGVAGVEHRMALLYTYGVLAKKISLRQWVALTSTVPARVFGLYPRKGAIQPGSDADLLLWAPTKKHVISAKTQHQRCDHTIYEGKALTGQPHIVFVNGVIAYEEGNILVEKGNGSYLFRDIQKESTLTS